MKNRFFCDPQSFFVDSALKKLEKEKKKVNSSTISFVLQLFFCFFMLEIVMNRNDCDSSGIEVWKSFVCSCETIDRLKKFLRTTKNSSFFFPPVILLQGRDEEAESCGESCKASCGKGTC